MPFLGRTLKPLQKRNRSHLFCLTLMPQEQVIADIELDNAKSANLAHRESKCTLKGSSEFPSNWPWGFSCRKSANLFSGLLCITSTFSFWWGNVNPKLHDVWYIIEMHAFLWCCNCRLGNSSYGKYKRQLKKKNKPQPWPPWLLFSFSFMFSFYSLVFIC